VSLGTVCMVIAFLVAVAALFGIPIAGLAFAVDVRTVLIVLAFMCLAALVAGIRR
jgi:hypothetical protein